MITIHPEFDGQWFWKSDKGELFEALSLRLLKAQLGPGYRIQDYYPNGYHKKTIWESEKTKFIPIVRPLTVAISTEEIDAGMSPSLKKKGGGARRYDHERILDLWSQGWTAPKIARLLNMPEWKRVGQIVSTYRQRGDVRAKPRTMNPNWRPPVINSLGSRTLASILEDKAND